MKMGAASMINHMDARRRPDASRGNALYAFQDHWDEVEPSHNPGRGLALAVKLSMVMWLGTGVAIAAWLAH